MNYTITLSKRTEHYFENDEECVTTYGVTELTYKKIEEIVRHEASSHIRTL